MKKTLLTTGAAFLTAYSAQAAVTLLVDFRGNDNFNSSAVQDFAAVDANVDFSSTVNLLTEGATVSGTGITATLTETAGNFSIGNVDLSRDGVAILDGYLSSRNSNASFTVSGFEEVAAGDQITLTVWAIGDTDGQESNVIMTYNGVDTTLGPTDAAAAVVSASDTRSYVQFSFTKVAGQDELTVVSERTGGRYSAINGFALTSVPEPSSAALLGLGGLALIMRRRK